ncbi:MAG: hypothetical protein JWM10_1231 [Myxococcaceae bacterium]|nr:hypothetical protein [Myxococcaceae bacterium]
MRFLASRRRALVGRAVVTIERWQAWWRRQGFGAQPPATPAAALEASGWLRSVGGGSPYLALFARGGFTPAQVERTLALVRDHLGDLRSFSLDSPERCGPRVEALRAAPWAYSASATGG